MNSVFCNASQEQKSAEAPRAMRIELRMAKAEPETLGFVDFGQLAAAVKQLSASGAPPQAKPKQEQRKLFFLDNRTDEQFDRENNADDEYDWPTRLLTDGCPDYHVEAEFDWTDPTRIERAGVHEEWGEDTKTADGLFVRVVYKGGREWQTVGFIRSFAKTGRPVAVHLDKRLSLSTARYFRNEFEEYPNVQLFDQGGRLAAALWKFLEIMRGEPFSNSDQGKSAVEAI
jgi:hypothetical protein